MKNSRILITEEERKKILLMYGLLGEQESQQKQITISGQTFFDNGKWKNLSQSGFESLNDQLQSAASFLVTNKGSVVYVKITAGESRVTNYDAEEIPKKPVNPGYLSNQRSLTLKKYLTNYFQRLINNGTISQLPIFEPTEIVIGRTPYTPGQPIDNPSYSAERFVKVELKIQSPEKCIVGLTIEVYYDSRQLCGKRHQCDKAIFDIYMNGVKVGQANLNNQNDGGNRTSGPITISPEQAQSIIGDQSKNIEISTQCMVSDDCHSSTPRVKISKGETILYNDCTPDIRQDRGDTRRKVILILDNCGNPIGVGDESNMDTTPETNQTDQNKIKQIKYYSTSATGNLDTYIKLLVDKKKVEKNSDGSLKALVPIDFNFNNQLTKVKKGETFKLI